MHDCTVLHDLMYCTGGYSRDNSAEVYNPDTDQWALIASMGSARYGHAVEGFGSRVYAFGGNYQNYVIAASCEAYDPSTNSWTVISSSPTKVVMTASAALGQYIYLIGGAGPNSNSNCNHARNYVQRYDPASDQWTQVAAMSTSRYQHRAVAMDGYIYAVAGSASCSLTNSVERYNPATNTWSQVDQLPGEGIWVPTVVAFTVP